MTNEESASENSETLDKAPYEPPAIYDLGTVVDKTKGFGDVLPDDPHTYFCCWVT